MTFLLDTNACIALIKGTPSPVRRAFAAALKRNDQVATSAISAFELWYGVARSAARERNAAAVDALLNAVAVFEFMRADGVCAGEIRAGLRSRGVPVGSYDVLIAGTAVSRQATLVTSNTREFSRVPTLTLVNWEDDGDQP